MSRIKLAGLGAHGVVKDTLQEDLPPEAWTDVRNVRFNSQGAKSFSGHRRVFSPASIQPLWIKPFPPITAPYWVYADETSVWTWRSGHYNLTRASGPYSAVTTERWQGEVFNGVGIFNNTIDVPQVWPTFSENVLLEDLPNWPEDLRCKWLRPYKNFLIAGYMQENGIPRPFRVRWSHPAQPGSVPDSWELFDPTKDSGEVDIADSPDYLVDGLTLGETFIIYKEKTVWAMQYVGGQNVFNFWQIFYDRGLLWRDCALALPGGHFVAGQEDIYVHNGQRGSERSIVQDRMKRWIYNQLSPDTFFNCFAMLNIAETEAWFCFPEAGETYATLALVWNWRTNSSGLRDLPRVPFAYAGVIDEEVAAATWGGGDTFAQGILTSSPATASAFGIRAIVADELFPLPLSGQSAAVSGTGQNLPPLTLPGGTYRATYTIPTTPIVPNYPYPTPIDFNLLSWVRDGGGDNNGWRTQPSQMILEFAGASDLYYRGYDGASVAGGAEHIMSFAPVVSGSRIELNLNGRTIHGTGGNGGMGPNLTSTALPTILPEGYYGTNGTAARPIFRILPAACTIVFRNGTLIGGGGGGGGGASEHETSVLTSATVGGGAGGGGGYGARGGPAATPVSTAGQNGGATTGGAGNPGQRIFGSTASGNPADGGAGGDAGAVGVTGQNSPVNGYLGGSGGGLGAIGLCPTSTTVLFENVVRLNWISQDPEFSSGITGEVSNYNPTGTLPDGVAGHFATATITVLTGANVNRAVFGVTAVAGGNTTITAQEVLRRGAQPNNVLKLKFLATTATPNGASRSYNVQITDGLNRQITIGPITPTLTRTSGGGGGGGPEPDPPAEPF